MPRGLYHGQVTRPEEVAPIEKTLLGRPSYANESTPGRARASPLSSVSYGETCHPGVGGGVLYRVRPVPASIAALCTPKRRSVSKCVGRSVAASGKCVFTKLAHLAPERCGRVVGLDGRGRPKKRHRSMLTRLYGISI